MFYDYEDEDFYTENEYQEEIDNLKEAIKKSVKRETTEEMNRLREENKKLQGIKKISILLREISRGRKTSVIEQYGMQNIMQDAHE